MFSSYFQAFSLRQNILLVLLSKRFYLYLTFNMHTYCLFFGILSDFSASNPPHFFPIRELKNRVNVSCSAFIFVVTRKVIINYYFLDTFKKIEVNKKKAKSC